MGNRQMESRSHRPHILERNVKPCKNVALQSSGKRKVFKQGRRNFVMRKPLRLSPETRRALGRISERFERGTGIAQRRPARRKSLKYRLPTNNALRATLQSLTREL